MATLIVCHGNTERHRNLPFEGVGPALRSIREVVGMAFCKPMNSKTDEQNNR